jgi:tripartite-type tricarboxylate transporter receptor subunit TctC
LQTTHRKQSIGLSNISEYNHFKEDMKMVQHRISILGRMVSVVGCALAFVVWLSPAWAADYPQSGKSIQLLVGSAAGSASDMGARAMAIGLEKELGVPVVTVNKPGANNQIALTLLAQSKPDGYTIGLIGFPVNIAGYLDPARKATYNRKSFETVAMHVKDVNIWAIKSTSPHKTLKDVFDAAKAKPNTITIAGGMMNEEQISTLLLQKMTGTQFVQVSFTQGQTAAMLALLGGKIDVHVGHQGETLGHAKSGDVRVLGILDDEESPLLPGVKTFEAQGYKIYSSASRGYIVPAGTSRKIVDTLSSAMKRVMATEEHNKRIMAMGAAVRYMDPDQFSKFWEESETQVKEVAPQWK